jgi:23S rRNA (cytosine1962-C5)-methyltransferase
MNLTVIKLIVMISVICSTCVTSFIKGSTVSRSWKAGGTSVRLLSMIGESTPKVILEKGKARLFQDGNPLIYGGAVKEVVGNPQPGDEVIVNDNMGNTLGRGVFNPFSQYRVRMMARTYESLYTLSFEDLLKVRIEQAIALRSAISLPSAKNSVYRLVNGEGDRLGGLVVDVLGTTVVAQSSAFWVERHKAAIESALLATVKSNKLVWRRAEGRLKQDGYTGDLADIVINSKSGNDAGNSEETEDLVVTENGVKYVVCPEDGQKTGFYCDQRDNRMMIREMSEGKTVLDTFCYSGGFSVNAALGESEGRLLSAMMIIL